MIDFFRRLLRIPSAQPSLSISLGDMHRDTTNTRTVEALLGAARTTFFGGIQASAFNFIVKDVEFGTVAYTLVCAGGFFVARFWLASRARSGQLFDG